MNGKHAIYRVYQALCAGMLSLFPAGRQTLVQGDGCITRIPELLRTHGIKAVQIITTPGTIRRGTIAPLLAQCEDAGIRTVLYTGVSPDPTVAEVEAAAECFFVSGCEAILAIGGGSVIDCAKVAGARTVRRDLPVRKMSGMLKIHKKLPLLLAVSKKSKSLGLKFSNEEMKIIIDSLMSEATPAQRQQINMMLNIMNQ